jgi:hypothetical protein
VAVLVLENLIMENLAAQAAELAKMQTLQLAAQVLPDKDIPVAAHQACHTIKVAEVEEQAARELTQLLHLMVQPSQVQEALDYILIFQVLVQHTQVAAEVATVTEQQTLTELAVQVLAVQAAQVALPLQELQVQQILDPVVAAAEQTARVVQAGLVLLLSNTNELLNKFLQLLMQQ